MVVLRARVLPSTVSGQNKTICESSCPFIASQSVREECTAERLFVSYEGLTGAVSVGSAILLDDGQVSVRVTDVKDVSVTGLVENNGSIKSRRGVNLPGAKVDLPALSDKDKVDIRYIPSACLGLCLHFQTASAALSCPNVHLVDNNHSLIRRGKRECDDQSNQSIRRSLNRIRYFFPVRGFRRVLCALACVVRYSL